jgi:hypothetical protein
MIVAKARKQEEFALMETAVVTAVEPLTVRARGIDYPARRAVSCLVAARLDDEVLVSLLADGRAYVLAVLERPLPGVEIAIDGDCALRATGEMNLVSREGMNVVSGEELKMVAGRFSLKSVASTIATETLDLVSRAVTTELDRAVVAARAVDGYFERITQRAKRSLRVVEEADQLRADRIDHAATHTMTLHAENAVVTAKELIKVDGSQIQLG